MKELEDYTWFPSVLRNYQTQFIGFVVSRFNVYNIFINYLKTLPLQQQIMADLCSGSGEPAISIFRMSNCFTRLSLSDKFPGLIKLNDDRITYGKDSKDVLKMEFEGEICYTMFNAFHHFTDEEKLFIVEKISRAGSSAFIVEILEPNFICLLKVIFTTIIGSVLLTPFILPWSVRRLFFTYIIPINILTTTFDGIISVFKSHSIQHYKKIFADEGISAKIFCLKKSLISLVVIQIERTK